MKLETLEQEHYYHIFNRGINSERIFNSEDNMAYFMKLMGKYLNNTVEIIAFCLMKNHFHLIVKITEEDRVSYAFSNLFNAYAKAFNKQQNRTGSLFEKHFKRKRIDSEDYLKSVIVYVHNNPIHNVQRYNFSSFKYYISNKQPDYFSLATSEVYRLFDTIDNVTSVHHISDPYLQGFKNLAGEKSKPIRLVTIA